MKRMVRNKLYRGDMSKSVKRPRVILKAINKAGSLMAACENLGLTYRRTWNDLKKVEKLLGFALLEKSRGGQDGGHSVLTSDGTRLIKAFDQFHARMDALMQKEFDQLLKELR